MLNQTSSEKTSAGLFQKASGKHVEISDEARRRVAGMFTSTTNATSSSVDTGSVQSGEGGGRSQASVDKTSAGLFQKASGKHVEISDEARRRVAGMFTLTTDINASMSISNSIKADQISVGPTTTTEQVPTMRLEPNGINNENVSVTSMRTKPTNFPANSYSNDNDNLPVIPRPIVTPVPGSITQHKSLLQKANGNSVVVSDAARRKAISILDTSNTRRNMTQIGETTGIEGAVRALDSQFALVDDKFTNVVLEESVFMEEMVSKANKELMLNSQRWALLKGISESQLSSSTFPTGQAIIKKHSMESENWRLSPDLYRRYLLLLRITSTNLLESLGQVHPSLQNIVCVTKDDIARKYSDEALHIFSWQNHYVPEIDLLEKGRWKTQQLTWICWTLLSHERQSPDLYLGTLISFENIFECLVHRYHRFQQHIERTTAALSSICSTRVDSSTHTINNSSRKRILHQQEKSELRKSQHVSALQRFQEICDWSWPLCLTISVQKYVSWGSDSSNTTKNDFLSKSSSKSPSLSMKSTPSPSSSGVLKEQWKLELTDGWWWIQVNLDALLMNLVRQKKLVDGMKVIVFAGKFNPEDTSCVQVTYHNLRRAHRHAPLGQVPKCFLTKGLPVSSIHKDGGTIFGLKVIVLGQTSQMGISSMNSQTHMARVSLSESEAERYLERIQEQYIEHQEQEMQEALKNGEMDEEEIQHYFQYGIGGRGKSGLLSEVNITNYSHLLVQCVYSGQHAWISLNNNASVIRQEFDFDPSDNGNASKRRKSDTSSGDEIGWVIGDYYFIGNILPSKRQFSLNAESSDSPWILQQSRSTTFTRLQNFTPLPKQPYVFVKRHQRQNDVVNSSIILISRQNIRSYSSLPIQLFHTQFQSKLTQQQNLPFRSIVGCYLTISLTLVAIYNSNTGEVLSVLSSKAKSPHSVSKQKVQQLLEEMPIRLVGVDKFGTCVDIHGTWFLHQLSSLRWMKTQEVRVTFENLLITGVDEKHGILRAEKTEISMVSESKDNIPIASTAQKRASFPLTPKGKSILHDDQSNSKWNPPQIAWIGIEEQLRLAALKENQVFYQSQWRLKNSNDYVHRKVEEAREELETLHLECQVQYLHKFQMCFDKELSYCLNLVSSHLPETFLKENYDICIVRVLVDYDVYIDESVSHSLPETLRSLPWQHVMQETELLPTHVYVPALFIRNRNSPFEDANVENLYFDGIFQKIVTSDPTWKSGQSGISLVIKQVVAHS